MKMNEDISSADDEPAVGQKEKDAAEAERFGDVFRRVMPVLLMTLKTAWTKTSDRVALFQSAEAQFVNIAEQHYAVSAYFISLSVFSFSSLIACLGAFSIGRKIMFSMLMNLSRTQSQMRMHARNKMQH